MGADLWTMTFTGKTKEEIEKEFHQALAHHRAHDSVGDDELDEGYWSDDERCRCEYDCGRICQVYNSGGFTFHPSVHSMSPMTTEAYKALEDKLDKWGPGFVAYVWTDQPNVAAMKKYRRWKKTRAKREAKIHALRATMACKGASKEQVRKWKATMRRWEREHAKRGPCPPAHMMLTTVLPC